MEKYLEKIQEVSRVESLIELSMISGRSSREINGEILAEFHWQASVGITVGVRKAMLLYHFRMRYALRSRENFLPKQIFARWDSTNSKSQWIAQSSIASQFPCWRSIWIILKDPSTFILWTCFIQFELFSTRYSNIDHSYNSFFYRIVTVPRIGMIFRKISIQFGNTIFPQWYNQHLMNYTYVT